MNENMLIREAAPGDVAELFRIESQCFPPDEAADEAGIAFRQNMAPLFFYVLEEISPKRIIGFINGTCTPHSVIDHDSMSSHDASSKTLVIHSVSLIPELRRRGIASAFLKEYVRRVAKSDLANTMLLLCKEHLIDFYKNSGFSKVGVSSVSHGQDTWYEMSLDTTKLQ